VNLCASGPLPIPAAPLRTPPAELDGCEVSGTESEGERRLFFRRVWLFAQEGRGKRDAALGSVRAGEGLRLGSRVDASLGPRWVGCEESCVRCDEISFVWGGDPVGIRGAPGLVPTRIVSPATRSRSLGEATRLACEEHRDSCPRESRRLRRDLVRLGRRPGWHSRSAESRAHENRVACAREWLCLRMGPAARVRRLRPPGQGSRVAFEERRDSCRGVAAGFADL
jgi:hypothetical protein